MHVRALKKIEELLEPLPAHRRVIVLRRALQIAKQQRKGQEQAWKQLAEEDVDTRVEL